MKKVLFLVSILLIAFITSIPTITSVHATVNSTQVDTVVSLPMDSVISDVQTSTLSNNKVRMLDATSFHNDATSCTSTVTTYVVAVHGGGQLFTGTQCWQVASNLNIHADSFGPYLTIALWVRFDSFPSLGNLACMINKPSEYGFCVDNGQHLETQLNGATQITGTTTLATNTFYFLSTTWNSTNVQVYVNGRNDTLTPVAFSSVITENSNALFVGASTCCAIASAFSGVMDSINIFKRPLSVTEMLSVASIAPILRPIDSYLPDTNVGTISTTGDSCTRPCVGYLAANSELPFAKGTAGSNADINSTTYIPGPISVHYIINITQTPQIALFTGCSDPILGASDCGHLRYQWDLFHNNAFQEGIGVAIGVETPQNNLCTGLNVCSLDMKFYKIVGNTFTDLFGGTAQIINGTSSVRINGYWIGIDLWITQDNAHVGLRVTNYSNSQTKDWSFPLNPNACFQGACSNGFIEQIVPLVDSGSNPHTIDWYDPYVQQNSELFNSKVTGGGDLTETEVVAHQAGFVVDGLCESVINLGLSIPNFLAGTNVKVGNCGSLVGAPGGTGPPTPPTGQSCGFFQVICDSFGFFSTSVISGIQAIMAPILHAINGLASAFSGALISGLGGAWQVFVGAIDQAIYLISGQSNVFSNFVNGTIGPIISNIAGILGGFSADFSATISAVTSLLGFFSASTNTPGNVNVLKIINTFLNNVIGSGLGFNPFTTAIFGTLGFFASLFGAGNGPGGSQFNVGGTTFDWGPGTVLAKALIPLFLILAFVWLFEKFMISPMKESQQMFWFVYVFAGVLIAMLGWFFEVTLKIASFIRDVIPIF